MKVRIYVGSGSHQAATAKALAEGFRKHGDSAEIAPTSKVLDCDLAVMWGHRQKHIMQRQRAAGRDYMVMERAYFGDRYKFVSLGFNGLNGHADFCNKGMPGDRWAKHAVPVANWKEGGDYVLVTGQCMGDCSLGNINYPAWVDAQIKAITAPVIFRPHPLGSPISVRAKISKGTLEQDLAKAMALVTYNSNSSVDAVLAGVPAVTMNRGAMAWDVTSRSWKDLVRPDRTQWLHDLAYCQWLPEEIAAGEAWAHLRRRYAT